ncbi:class I SAM-dependent methyltransferase [Zobellella iuensis]|uniref:Class I SAM-dependent methyltransferase n=1 Tax=Zobellella iuensis TaxID=2803811 RepID=A0ABS1QU47_9GAMM|nr:class I SAM-dependent methyltransferase [Zobellella iuensis]MBL1378402.1 class I SAM-dependent methyltransferase [Zobellella iuensis]
MKKSGFELYGAMAEAITHSTSVAGRYRCQEVDERNIISDIMRKLSISSNDQLLEIGCNLGKLLTPLSYMVEKSIGIDHPLLISRYQTEIKKDNIKLVPGNFLEIENEKLGHFNKILIYSVIHALPDNKSLDAFIDKALQLLSAGGLMLIGDIPNEDKKNRFLASRTGKIFNKEWEERRALFPETESVELDYKCSISFNDELLCSLMLNIRKKGYNAHILAQPENLPFGRTREDLLIVKPD